MLAAIALAAACTARADSGDPLRDWLQQRGLVAARSVHDAASQLVLAALNFLDVRYRLGGDSADEGFDCSGFTRYVYDTAIGVELPRRAAEQAHDEALATVSREQLGPGDLVFFNTRQRDYSHVGIYLGDGRFIHAPRPGAQVRIESLSTRYWARRFDGGRRWPQAQSPMR